MKINICEVAKTFSIYQLFSLYFKALCDCFSDIRLNEHTFVMQTQFFGSGIMLNFKLEHTSFQTSGSPEDKIQRVSKSLCE